MKFPLSWSSYPLHQFLPEQVEVLDDGKEFPPHAVLRLHLPGRNTISALFCWSKENMGNGVGINEKAFERYKDYGYGPYVYLLGLRWRPRRNMPVDEQLKVIIKFVGGKRPRPHHPIQGRLVELSEVDMFLPLVAKKRNKLHHASGPFMRFADPEHFDPIPLNQQVAKLWTS